MALNQLKIYATVLRSARKIAAEKKTEEGRLNGIAAELLRNTHSIEKGLSISNPRLGFGHQKQQEMMGYVKALYHSSSDYHKEACAMALNALQAYILYHNERGYTDDVCKQIEEFLKQYPADKGTEGFSGALTVKKSDMDFDVEKIEEFFKTRHSIRDFDGTPVDDETLKKALALAQTAPSACNRQGVRAYVLSHDKTLKLAKQLEGIGGFADAVDRFVVITGKTSAYRNNEINQYIVSPSIYAAYLSLTLHLYGLGACVVQRPVIWNKKGNETQRCFGIPTDEQIICLLAVGNLKEEFTAPVSHRLSASVVTDFVD